jgi:hypothetical protein
VNIQQAQGWLEEQPLSEIVKQDYRLMLRRISEYEPYEIEIALGSVIHEIRARIARKEASFKELIMSTPRKNGLIKRKRGV